MSTFEGVYRVKFPRHDVTIIVHAYGEPEAERRARRRLAQNYGVNVGGAAEVSRVRDAA